MSAVESSRVAMRSRPDLVLDSIGTAASAVLEDAAAWGPFRRTPRDLSSNQEESTVANDNQRVQPARSSRTIAVDYVRIETNKPFLAVKAALETLVPPLRTEFLTSLRIGDVDNARIGFKISPIYRYFRSVTMARYCESSASRTVPCNMR